LEDPGVDERIVLRWNLGRGMGRVKTGIMIWHRTGTRDRHL
jgi:hypothetical protein